VSEDLAQDLIHEKVRQVYHDLLKREPDTDGLHYWTELVERTGDIQDVIKGVRESEEYILLGKAQELHQKTVYSNIEYLARAGRIEKLIYNGYSRPLALKVETTNICNNDCIICPYSSQKREKHIMSLGIFKKILEDYRMLGGGDLSLTPIVGDLFCDKYLIPRLDMIKTCGSVKRLSVTTNAVLALKYDDSALEYIVQSFDRFKISVYGLDREEYRVMTRKDEYEKALQSISKIMAYSKSNVVIGIRHLKKRSPEFVREWVEGLKKSSGCRYPVEVTEAADEYNNWSVLNTHTALPFDAKWQCDYEAKEQCFIPLLYSQVLSSGDVSFCSCANFDAHQQLMLGSIRDSSLAELYSSPKCSELYSWPICGVPEFCKTCSFYTPFDVFLARWPDVFTNLPLN
jgi:MoaA/NifB/PqqE/SkfB family radical SAM enzyme